MTDEIDLDEDDLDYCVECGDPFHFDDTGGYNPPCPCCGLCRSCCYNNPNNLNPDDDWYPEDSEA